MLQLTSLKILAISIFLFSTSDAWAVKLVSEQTIKEQKALTQTYKLKNGIKVIHREIPGSDILQLNVEFASGLKELPTGQKVLNQWMWSALTFAGKDWPKEKVFSNTEKYAISIGCSGGIEMSTCSLGTLNQYWQQSLPMFTALVKTPAFTDEDVGLTKDRLIASLKSTPSDPSSFVNEVVNRIYYPKGHPYRLNHDEALAELEKLSAKDLKGYHKQMLNADLMTFVIVGSMDAKSIIADLNKHFGDIPKGPVTTTNVKEPAFELKTALEVEDRDIPTAYIRAKLVAPPVDHKDATATRLMFEILSEELGEEIRTKRSLSYSVYSFVIQYSMGIGVLSASTSKPQETLEAMNDVIQMIKSKTYTQAELDEYKTVFATSYFLTLETHASLASALTSNEHFLGYEHLYEFPKKLDAVTPADIQRLAKELLVDLRVGVIYSKEKFKNEWATKLIKANLKKSDDANEKSGH